MKRQKIQHFASESDQKAAVVERFNRIIKTRILTYLSDRGIVSWVSVIQDLVNSYNHSRQRSIGMAHADVQNRDENRLWVWLYGDWDSQLKGSISQGALVRASSQKTIFDKGDMPNWTKEHFTVSQALPVRRRTNRRLYKLVDYYNDEVKAAVTQKSFRKLQKTSMASKKF